jgi:Uma2 family endonuclease
MPMTIANRPSPTSAKSPQFQSFAEYLAADIADLPEGRCEYWDGELVPVMAESIDNLAIANYLFAVLIQAGIPVNHLYPHSCEVEVPGQPRTRYPDLTVIDPVHLQLLKKRATLTRDMPPPRLLAEVVSPGSETSDNYKRDYQEKARQYAQIGVSEYWLIDPQRAVVLIGMLVDGRYQFTTFAGSQNLVSSTFPDLPLTAEQLLNTGT